MEVDKNQKPALVTDIASQYQLTGTSRKRNMEAREIQLLKAKLEL